MKTRKILPVLAVLMLVAESALAANYFVRAGASGNGTDWANAFGSLPATLVRGGVYYVADGSYGSYTFDDAASGTSVITVKKATVSDHGTSTGWSDGYGDGQASFGSFIFAADYYVIDGKTRNESNWSDGASYGFRISSFAANTAWTAGVCASHLTAKYSNLGGADVGNIYTGNEQSSGFYIFGGDESCTNWTISRNYIHNTIVPFHMNGADTGTIEYNWISNSFGKEAIRGQVNFSNYIIRHNVIKDACQKDPEDSTSGCTAEIAIWDGSNFSGNQIYGNIFQKTNSAENSGGAIIVGGNGSSWVGPSASNTLVYNNTIVGLKGWNAQILINGGSGNIARNNIWSDCAGSSTGATANTTSNNYVLSTSAFVSYPNNLHLSAATTAGYQLSSPYNMDMDGNQRGVDGVWDAGAYEYGISSPDAIPPTVSITAPTPNSAVSGSTVVMADASDNVGVAGVQFKLDGVNLDSEDTASPYSISWNTGNSSSGSHTLAATARDAAGNIATSQAITVSVVADTVPPTVIITAPVPNSSVFGSIVVTANPSDNVGIAGVQFNLDGANIGSEDTTSPYSTSWNTATVSNGIHVLKAIARDTSGNNATSSETSVVVSNSSASSSEGLLVAYSFNENTGMYVYDRSGNNNVGTISGASWSPGKYGSALSFNGINNYVNLGSILNAGTANITIESWVYRRDNSDSRVVCKAVGTALTGHIFCLGVVDSGSENIARVRLTTSSGSSGFDGTIAFPTLVWTHLAFTYDGSTVTIYVNGAQAGSYAKTGDIVSSAQAAVLGNINVSDARYFNGLIDDLRIYSRALTQAEIQIDMNSSPSLSKPSGLSAE